MKDLNSYNQLHQRWELHAKSFISRVVLLTCSHLFHPDRHSHVCPMLPGIQSLLFRSSTFRVQLDFSMSTHWFTQKVHFTPNNWKSTCQSLYYCEMNVSNVINSTGNWDYSCEFKGYFRRYTSKMCVHVTSLLTELISKYRRSGTALKIKREPGKIISHKS